MDETPPQPPPTPRLSPAAEAALHARREREAAALRDNLRRRKQQTRDKPGVPAMPPREGG